MNDGTAPVVLGVDCGLASFGVALVELRAQGERVVRLEVVRTQKEPSKRQVLAADDTVRRCRELAARLLAVVEEHRPRVIAAERQRAPAPSTPALDNGT